jgi:hypothetical protein
MVEGTMKWTSSTQEFGFLSPTDGTRDVFVCLLPNIGSRCLSMHLPEQASLNAPAVPGEGRHRGVEEHDLASRVEVRTRYQQGQWASGYEIAEVVDSGYRVRRPGSLEVVPEIVVPTDVRRAGDEG